jgi:putative SOS response-associated peptidase YedK
LIFETIMCGRFAQIRHSEKYAKRFGLKASDNLDLDVIPANYNTDIGNPALIAGQDQVLTKSTFGFSPGWADKQMYLFNARSEGDFNPANDSQYAGPMGIFDKPSFRQAMKTQRAVVPVDYFLEGPEKEKLKKPFLIRRKDEEPFLIAGIWSLWEDKVNGEKKHTFSILTTAQNELLAKVGHHRSPLVLPDHLAKIWLDPNAGKETLSQLMIPFDDQEFEAYPVDPKAGKRNTTASPNNDPSLMVPVGPAFSVH